MNDKFNECFDETSEENDQSVEVENEDIVKESDDIEQTISDNNTNDISNSQNSFSENLANDLQNGLHSILYLNINNVTINDVRIRDVFTRFLKEVECSGSFRLIDVINAAEWLAKTNKFDENAGNLIYSYDHNLIGDKRICSKFLKYSVGGIYSLFSLHNGIVLDIDAIGSSLPAAEAKRYLILPPKKVNKFLGLAKSIGTNLIKAGEFISSDKILLTRNNSVIASVDKTGINSNSNVSVTLGSQHFGEFLSGYNAVCTYNLCGCVSSNNLIKLGLNGDVSAVCARVLGHFAAMFYLKNTPVRVVYTSDSNVNVAVPRPNAADGDYLYLLKVRDTDIGTPDMSHYGQLYYYLGEKKKMGIIKDVLPVGENIFRVINRLCNEQIEYVPLASIDNNGFGIIVSVGRGESVNGIKLGYFKNKL